jgi:hypothetical protein
MPFALLIFGAVLLISAARGTTTQGPNGGPGLFTLLEGDFTGQNNFIYWFLAILVIGAVGYIPKLKPVSVAFLTLVIMVLFLKKGNPSGAGGGFFSQILAGVGTTQSVTPAINNGAAASAGGSSLTSLLSGVEPSNPNTAPSSGIASNASLNGSSLTNLLAPFEPSNTSVPVSSPVATPATFGSSLLPSGSSTDLTFPSLGIGV